VCYREPLGLTLCRLGVRLIVCRTNASSADPVTGEKLWDVPIATQQDVDDAVVSAQKAFEKFRYTEMSERKKLLQKIKDQYMSHVDEIAELLIKETGKPVSILFAHKVDWC
jgi:acyl-CoA reductase-like NAD-dependent aldehyde dehydrogenase